jgi:hypothetical protein
MYHAAAKICDDCGKNDRPLSWSQDGYTKICDPCADARGGREKVPASPLKAHSEAAEDALRSGDAEMAMWIIRAAP